jgi:hypothetical protein
MHGSPEVPIPVEPAGQSSRGLGGGGGGVGVGVGAGAAAEAVGFSATGSFFASSSQPTTSVATRSANGSFDDWIASDMGF